MNTGASITAAKSPLPSASRDFVHEHRLANTAQADRYVTLRVLAGANAIERDRRRWDWD